MNNTLLVEDMNFSYGSKKVLSDVSFSCTNGVVALLGHNGAGKTTLMNILTGLKKPSSGKIMLNDIDILNEKEMLLSTIGYLPQNFDIYNNISGIDFLSYVCDVKGVHNGQKKDHIENLVKTFNLSEVIKKPIGRYSGGYKRRLGIAQSMIGDPNLVIVDEPTVGLDPEQRLEFRSHISKIGRERITLISTHIIEDVELYSDQILIMKYGKILFQGTVDQAIGQSSKSIYTIHVKLCDIEIIREKVKIIEEKRLSNDTIKIKFIGSENILKGSCLEREVTLENAYVYFQTQ